MKNSNDTIWNRTSDLPICSTTPSPLCYRSPRDKLVNAINAVLLRETTKGTFRVFCHRNIFILRKFSEESLMTNEQRDCSAQKKLAAISSEILVPLCHIKRQGCAFASCPVTLVTKFYRVVLNVCGCSVWMLYVAFLECNLKVTFFFFFFFFGRGWILFSIFFCGNFEISVIFWGFY